MTFSSSPPEAVPAPFRSTSPDGPAAEAPRPSPRRSRDEVTPADPTLFRTREKPGALRLEHSAVTVAVLVPLGGARAPRATGGGAGAGSPLRRRTGSGASPGSPGAIGVRREPMILRGMREDTRRPM